MFNRWGQESFFKYMLEHFSIDALHGYGGEPIVVRNGNTPQKAALRARTVLFSADGIPTGEIMRQLGTTTPTISRGSAEI